MKHPHRHPDQSLAGAVREQLETIERRVKNGVRLKKIHAELVALGHSKSFKNFESALYRARKNNKQTAGAAPVAPKPREVPVQQSVAIPPSPSPMPEIQADGAAPGAQPDYFKRKPLIGQKP